MGRAHLTKPMSHASHAPARAVVSLAAIRHNAALLAAAAAAFDAELMCVIKADAYGHGAAATARALLAAGVKAFAVATLPEAIELRLAGVAPPATILVFGSPASADAALMVQHAVDATVASAAAAAALVAGLPAGGRLRAHIMVETGMARLGVQPRDVEP